MVRGAYRSATTRASHRTLVCLGAEKTNLAVQQISSDIGEVRRDVVQVKRDVVDVKGDVEEVKCL